MDGAQNEIPMLTLIAMALFLALLPVGNAFADPYDPNAPFALMPEDLHARPW